MRSKWLTTVHSRLADADFYKAATRLRLTARLDSILFIVLGSAIALFTATWIGIIVFGNRFDWFNPPLLQPLADERSLVNIRDTLGGQPLQDAVYHVPADQMVLTQEGGTVHWYEPSTHLWRTETPFAKADLRNPTIIDI